MGVCVKELFKTIEYLAPMESAHSDSISEHAGQKSHTS